MADEQAVVEVPEHDFGYREENEYIDDPGEQVVPLASLENKEEVVEPPVKPEPEKVVEVAEPVTEKIIEKPAEITATDWKEALKKADKYEALKELGYDDFTIGMLKYKEQTGDVTPYLQVKTVDYTKMTPEQLIKQDMIKANPGMSDKALNFKFNKEISEKYYLNRDDYPEDSDEAIYGQEQLRLDGEAKRKSFIEEQDKFKAPEPQPDLDATKREAELQQQKAALGSAVMNNDATKTLQTAKSLVFGEGEESFNYPITDVQPLVDTALNTILNSGRTDLSGVDMNVFYKQLAYGSNPAAFETAFAKHHQALAKKKFQSELQNVTPVSGGVPEIEKDLTPAQQLARYGKLT